MDADLLFVMALYITLHNEFNKIQAQISHTHSGTFHVLPVPCETMKQK